jgi:hypothetical protein
MRAMFTAYSRWIRTNPKGSNNGATWLPRALVGGLSYGLVFWRMSWFWGF